MSDSGMGARSQRLGSSWSHRIAILTAAATLPLLFIGGLVTTKGAGLAVPDWPTTFGENMFLFPWSKMVGGIFYEHSHRLIGAAVGFLTLVLAVWLWTQETRTWLRWLGMAALLLVIVQGVIGGLRVVLAEDALAILHACLAQAFFALVVTLALLTSGEWTDKPRPIESAHAGRIQILGILTTALVYLQVIFGAFLRHTGSWLEMHVILAALVAWHAILLVRRVWSLNARVPKLDRAANVLAGTLLLQLSLGFGSYLGRYLPDTISHVGAELFTTAHVVVGAALLVTSLVFTLRSFRLLAQPAKLSGRPLVSRGMPV